MKVSGNTAAYYYYYLLSVLRKNIWYFSNWDNMTIYFLSIHNFMACTLNGETMLTNHTF